MTGFDLATAILTLLPRVLDVTERILNGMDKRKLDSFFDALETSMDEIANARDEKEKIQAAKRLVGAIRNIR